MKTDHRDSTKLAMMLAGGFLKRVHVLSPEERAHRQLLRTRNQIEKHRKQTQGQIKSMLRSSVLLRLCSCHHSHDKLNSLGAPVSYRKAWMAARRAWRTRFATAAQSSYNIMR